MLNIKAKDMMDKEKRVRFAPLLEQVLGMLGGKRSVRTLANYYSSISKVKEFVGDGWERLMLDDITGKWTDEYAAWLKRRHAGKPQTVDFYMRTFRAVYVHARSFAVRELEKKPFEGCRSGGRYPACRALRLEEARCLLSPRLRKILSRRQREVLDVLTFIFYARGMAFKDVYELTWQWVECGHIRYRRSKTGVSIDVEVVAELGEIMQRYKRDDSPFVFPFLHEGRNGSAGKELSEQSVLRRVNRLARKIGKRVGLSVPLTTYVIRHTWATLMQEDGHPVELIGQCMGHTSIHTTQIYLSQISSRKVDMAVDGMYDHLIRSKEEAADPKEG